MTRGQIDVLFRHAMEREYERMKFFAAIQGAEIKDDKKSKPEPQKIPNMPKKYQNCVMGVPESYAHLTKEEKKELTEIWKRDMMGFFGS